MRNIQIIRGIFHYEGHEESRFCAGRAQATHMMQVTCRARPRDVGDAKLFSLFDQSFPTRGMGGRFSLLKGKGSLGLAVRHT